MQTILPFRTLSCVRSSFCSRVPQVVAASQVAGPLGGSGDSRSRRGDVLGLVLSLGLGSLGGLGDGSLLLGNLVGGGLLGGLLSGDILGGFLGGLLLGLGGALALDSSTELGERALAGLLLAVDGRGRLLALAEGEGQRRLALLLDLLLGLTVSGGGLDGLGGDRGGVRDVHSPRGRRLNGRDDGGGGIGGGSVTLLGGLGGLLGGLGRLSRLLLLLGEDIAEEAVALGRSGLLLGALSGGSLLGGLVLDGRSLSGGGRSLLDLGSLSLGGSLSGDGGVLRLGLLLLLLLLAEAEERSALAASGAALGLLLLGLLLGGSLALLGRLLGLGLLSLGGLLSGGSLLGNDGSGLEALDGLLEGVGLGDSGGELLGLGDLELQLGDPAVTLSGRGGLEAVLVALGSEVELVGAIDLGLAGIGL